MGEREVGGEGKGWRERKKIEKGGVITFVLQIKYIHCTTKSLNNDMRKSRRERKSEGKREREGRERGGEREREGERGR